MNNLINAILLNKVEEERDNKLVNEFINNNGLNEHEAGFLLLAMENKEI